MLKGFWTPRFDAVLDEATQEFPLRPVSESFAGFEVKLDAYRKEKSAKKSCVYQKVTVSVFSLEYSVFKGRVDAEWKSGAGSLPRTRSGSSGLIGLGEITVVLGQTKKLDDDDLGPTKAEFLKLIEQLCESLNDKDSLCGILWNKLGIYRQLSIPDHWQTLFWSAVRAEREPPEIRAKYANQFPNFLAVELVERLTPEDLRQLAQLTAT